MRNKRQNSKSWKQPRVAPVDVYWLEQSDTDVPEQNEWLSAGETLRLDGLRFAKRRADWRLGRWTAKRALAACLNLPGDLPALANIEIRAAPSGAPEVFLFSTATPATISLSHRDGTAICVVGPCGHNLGCDLETIEPRSEAFIADYFTISEQALVDRVRAEDRPPLVALLWSAKESTLKALHEGLRLDTNCVEAIPLDASSQPVNSLLTAGEDSWRPLRVCYNGTQVFHGWWRFAGHLVRTVVSAVPLHPPVPLTSLLSEISLPATFRRTGISLIL